MNVIGISSLDLYRRAEYHGARRVASGGPDADDRRLIPVARAAAGAGSDTVTISAEARAVSGIGNGGEGRGIGADDETARSGLPGEKQAEARDERSIEGEQNLTEAEQREVQKLKTRDAEVRAHEQAHRSAGGRYAGAASYEYTQGPDNRRYATGGEVSIDMSPVHDNPQATIQKMQVVKRAAMAPAQPSSQDHSVHAAASRTEQRARTELTIETAEETNEAKPENSDQPPQMINN